MWEVFDTLSGESVAMVASAYRARRIVERPGSDRLDYALAGIGWVPVEPAGCVVRTHRCQSGSGKGKGE